MNCVSRISAHLGHDNKTPAKAVTKAALILSYRASGEGKDPPFNSITCSEHYPDGGFFQSLGFVILIISNRLNFLFGQVSFRVVRAAALQMRGEVMVLNSSVKYGLIFERAVMGQSFQEYLNE